MIALIIFVSVILIIAGVVFFKSSDTGITGKQAFKIATRQATFWIWLIVGVLVGAGLITVAIVKYNHSLDWNVACSILVLVGLACILGGLIALPVNIKADPGIYMDKWELEKFKLENKK
jgi:cell division protein FtsW (lipid II flippase)